MDNSVELIGYYGSDETHALSAWTSTKRELTDERQTRMGGLLSYLAKEGHHTPFEKSLFHFLVKCDTASHIQFLKHRIGVSVNAESARYKELKADSAYLPHDWPEEQRHALQNWTHECYVRYHKAIEELEPILGRDRAKESARFYLPYANQLLLDVTFNFRSFAHFQKLRNADDAQSEIQVIAQKMLSLVKATGDFDLTLKAFGWYT